MRLVLRPSSGRLSDVHDLAMLDLDGVVYVGPAAVPGAAEHLAAARSAGQRIAFITNNASRSARVVAQHLTDLGVSATAGDVVTSAQAAARLVLDRWGPGAHVVCLGGEGLRGALLALGLVPVDVGDEAAAVVSGYGPEVRWSEITRAAIRIREGLPWVASNADGTFPTAEGLAPGHGVLVAMLSGFTGVSPVVAGKPERPLLDETVRRVGGERPLMVGDRLDTDIEGANRLGMASLLVLTGVTRLPELVAAGPELRPSHLAADLGGLTSIHRAPRRDPGPDGAWRLGVWSGRIRGGALRLERTGRSVDTLGADVDAEDGWRVAAMASWEHLDATGDVVDISGLHVPDPASLAR